MLILWIKVLKSGRASAKHDVPWKVVIWCLYSSESNLKFIEYSTATHDAHMFIGERQDHCRFLLARRRNTPLVDRLTEMHMQANDEKKKV